nr:hypothetical protein [Bdellovibrionales bacterium]
MRRIGRKPFLVSLAAVLIACGALTAFAEFHWPNGKHAMNSEYVKLTYSIERPANPADCLTTAQASINFLLYQGLFRFDDETRILPGLAEFWSFDRTGTRLTIGIAKNHRFSDGTPVRRSDVLRALEYLFMKSANRSQFANVSTVRASGESNIEISMKERSPLILPLLASGMAVVYKAGHSQGGSGP